MARVWLGLPSEKHILIVGDKLYTLEMDEEMGMDVLKRYRIVWLERN